MNQLSKFKFVMNKQVVGHTSLISFFRYFNSFLYFSFSDFRCSSLSFSLIGLYFAKAFNAFNTVGLLASMLKHCPISINIE